MRYVTHYDEPLLTAFFRFNILRTATKKRKMPALVFFSLVVYLGSAYFLFSATRAKWVFLSLSAIVLFCDALVFYLWKTVGTRTKKQNPALFSAVNEYAFESRFISVSSVAGEAKEERTLPYDDLKTVVETPQAFYLFLTESSGYIVNKAETTQADAERLTVFLQNKCKNRYYYRTK